MASASRHRLIGVAAGAICLLSRLGYGEDKTAPVESATTITQKEAHEQPTTVPANEATQWLDMMAWKSKSNLSQTGQLVNPAGKSLRINGRLMGLALARGGKFLVAKTDARLTIVDTAEFKIVRQNAFPEEKDGGSMHGLAVSRDGSTVYFTGKTRNLYVGTIDDDGLLTLTATINLSTESVAGPNPLGVALSPDGKTALVALAVSNEIAVVDLAGAKVSQRIAVGVCPYAIAVAADGKTAFVSNFGGPRPKKRDATAISVGTEVAVDARSVALRGSVSVVDLGRGKTTSEIVTGIHSEAMTLSADGQKLYVVESSGDGIAEIDVASQQITHHFSTKPQADLPYGSLTDGLALSPDGKTIYAANAGNNAIAMLDSAKPDAAPYAFIPAGGFPGAVLQQGNDLYIGNVIGYYGQLQKVTLPQSPEELAAMTSTAKKSFHFAEIVRAATLSLSKVAAQPLPAKLGEPSNLKHVVYIIKENKKFDQVLGDIGRGNAEPKLVEFGRATTPNTHALADQFVLLDNYYCNGVLSCDGHQWATQGITSPIREKDWSNKHIAYDFGIDPLANAGCGFIWDHLLRKGLSFRSFGELEYSVLDKGTRWTDFYTAWKNKQPLPRYALSYKIDLLKRYSDPAYPGWEMNIPDQVRADIFLKALAGFEKAGEMPNFVIVYLPNDHTRGATKDSPSPRAYVADNDLAAGRVIEALSRSPFWKDMVIFMNEDDPQTGTDHVDGHRSFCLVAGPYVKRGGPVISKFYNQSSVLHTICQIFGVPPMNQSVAMSPLMQDVFTDIPNFEPYHCLPANVALDEMNPDPKKTPNTTQSMLAPHTMALDFDGPDRIDDDAEMFSRWVWSTTHGEEPFPIEYWGPHGKGLAPLGLQLDPNAPVDDDDDLDDSDPT